MMKSLEELISEWNKGARWGAQTLFAQQIGVTRSSVSRWVTGDSVPDPEMNVKIAKILNISVEELLKVLPVKRPLPPRPETVKKPVFRNPKNTNLFIPILGNVSAQAFKMEFDLPPEEYLPFPNTANYDFFALRVKGDCMAPKISDGDMVIVKKQEWANNKEIVVARVEDSFTLKQFIQRKNAVELVPFNPKYEALKGKEFEIIGKVYCRLDKFT